MSAVVVPPRKVGRFAEFRELVIAGGEVNPNGLTSRLLGCRLLGYVVVENELVSVGALKEPSLERRREIAADAGASLEAHTLELGYFVTKEGHRKRGYARAVADALVAHLEGPCYATAREDNLSMRMILSERGFQRVGTSWASRRNPQKRLTLWVRP